MKSASGILIGLLMISLLSPAVDKRLEDRSGLFAVEMQGRWGFIDARGRVVIEPVYDEVGFFSEGLASVRIGNKWGYIDPAGKMVIPAGFAYADYFSEGLAAVSDEGLMGYINRGGEPAVPCEFDEAMAFSQGLARVRKQQQWGFISREGKFIIPLQFEDAYDFSEDAAAVLYAGKWGFIDRSGRYILEARFDSTYEFRQGWAEVSTEGGQNFINKNGHYMTDGTTFLSAQNFFEGLAAAQSVQNGKYGYIDQTGKFIIPAQYDLTFPFHEGLAAVSRSGRYGFIDKNGKETIPLQYSFADVFIGGLARVKNETQWLYIDKKGNTVWPLAEPSRGVSSLEVDIQYDMAGITQVFIKDGRLIYVNSESQGPDLNDAGMPEAYSRSSEGVAVTPEETGALIELIKNSGFLDLNDSYGTSPDDRHYPVRISIRAGGIEKHVFYRSHPNYPAPKAFQQVEAALIEFARGKLKIRKEMR